jgi:hypothetical protein
MSGQQEESKHRTLLIISAVLVIGLATAGRALSEVSKVADFPLVVFCEYKGTGKAYYFSELGPDGIAIYMTPDNRAASITIKGTPQIVGGDRSGDCANKTIDQLRAAGQAFDIQR